MAGPAFTRDCTQKPLRETILNAIIAGLITEKRLPANGSIVDAGAADGRFACFFAAIAPNRLVHAVDPNYKNVRWMQQRYVKPFHGVAHPNLRPFHGGLGDSLAANDTRVRKTLKSATQNFTLHRLDDLYFGGPWTGELLALGHFDVEGWEEAVMRGATRVVARDAPILTTEASVQRQPGAARSLLRLLDRLGYDSFLVEEIAGMQADVRNILHIPRARRAQLRGSHILDLAVASRSLLAVTPENIQDLAYPCCRPGDVCCPNKWRCCSHGLVHQWLSSVIQKGGHDLQWYTRTSWYDAYKHTFRPEMLEVQEEERTRNASAAGLSFNRVKMTARARDDVEGRRRSGAGRRSKAGRRRGTHTG